MKPRAYSYLRYSTPEQAQGDSHRRQIRMAEEYALLHGLDLDATLTFQDLGVSGYRGANSETGRLGDFLEAVKVGDVPASSWLLVESLDRISRQAVRKAQRVLEDILAAGVTVVTLNDGKVYSEAELDRDPMALIWSILTFIRANGESAEKGRRVAAAWQGKRERAKQTPLTEIAPAWLDLNRATQTFDVVPERADVVRRIFAMTLAGTGLERIASTFNREGIPCFGTAAHWHRSYVSKIVQNEAVIGTMTPHVMDHTGERKVRRPLDPVPNYFPAVVAIDAFQAVQAQRQGVRAPQQRAGTAPLQSLLAGLARCPLCEGTMTRVMKGTGGRAGKPYLVCRQAKLGAGCHYRAVPQNAIEAALKDHLEALIAVPPVGDDGAGVRLGTMQAELVAVDRAIANVVDALIGQPSPALRAKLTALEADKASVEADLRQAATATAVADPVLRSRRVAELRAALEVPELDRARVNVTLRQCFEWVTVDYRMEWLLFGWRQGGVGTIPYGPPEAPPKAA